MDYWKAYRSRLKRNQEQLLKLADEVIAMDSSVEVCYYDGDEFISGITFFKFDMINAIQFSEAPYKWSGCGVKEHLGFVGEDLAMPFTAKDVLTTFKKITSLRNYQGNKSNKLILNWKGYLKRYIPQQKKEAV